MLDIFICILNKTGKVSYSMKGLQVHKNVMQGEKEMKGKVSTPTLCWDRCGTDRHTDIQTDQDTRLPEFHMLDMEIKTN